MAVTHCNNISKTVKAIVKCTCIEIENVKKHSKVLLIAFNINLNYKTF